MTTPRKKKKKKGEKDFHNLGVLIHNCVFQNGVIYRWVRTELGQFAWVCSACERTLFLLNDYAGDRVLSQPLVFSEHELEKQKTKASEVFFFQCLTIIDFFFPCPSFGFTADRSFGVLQELNPN